MTLCSEEEAARAYDRTAIRHRGRRVSHQCSSNLCTCRCVCIGQQGSALASFKLFENAAVQAVTNFRQWKDNAEHAAEHAAAIGDNVEAASPALLTSTGHSSSSPNTPVVAPSMLQHIYVDVLHDSYFADWHAQVAAAGLEHPIHGAGYPDATAACAKLEDDIYDWEAVQPSISGPLPVLGLSSLQDCTLGLPLSHAASQAPAELTMPSSPLCMFDQEHGLQRQSELYCHQVNAL